MFLQVQLHPREPQSINGGDNGKTGILQNGGAFVEYINPVVFPDLKGFECKSCPDV